MNKVKFIKYETAFRFMVYQYTNERAQQSLSVIWTDMNFTSYSWPRETE